MRTAQEYLEKLAGMRPNIYLNGEAIGRDHPIIVHSSQAYSKRPLAC